MHDRYPYAKPLRRSRGTIIIPIKEQMQRKNKNLELFLKLEFIFFLEKGFSVGLIQQHHQLQVLSQAEPTALYQPLFQADTFGLSSISISFWSSSSKSESITILNVRHHGAIVS